MIAVCTTMHSRPSMHHTRWFPREGYQHKDLFGTIQRQRLAASTVHSTTRCIPLIWWPMGTSLPAGHRPNHPFVAQDEFFFSTKKGADASFVDFVSFCPHAASGRDEGTGISFLSSDSQHILYPKITDINPFNYPLMSIASIYSLSHVHCPPIPDTIPDLHEREHRLMSTNNAAMSGTVIQEG